ncbi:uncharacterized protein [Rutidosis leptorrhynchoides]|uniref:uncharacterized protein isoform X1 n=1 Tax=Rutidosis leptorrhynchoides TaxID=125765 RepID=UPI003A996AC3
MLTMMMMMSTIIPQAFTNLTRHKTPKINSYNCNTISTKPTKFYFCSYNQHSFRFGFGSSDILSSKKKKRVVLVRLNNLKFNGSGGGGGNDDDGTAKVLGNIALAIGLTYLTLTGQLGWILDTIVSVWLFVVIVPIVGLGALVWWAMRDMVEIQCRNCQSQFEVFKSMLNDEPQLCPYCNQPFSVVGDEFVRDPARSSKESTTFDGAFNELFSQTKKGKASSRAVIDVEAEVKDVD